MESAQSTEPSISTRLRVWFEGIPFATRGVFVVCVGLYLYQLLTGWFPLPQICLQVSAVVERYQIHRLFVHAFFHVGALHLVFNMMAFVPIGSRLERQMGTVKFLYMIGLIMTLADLFSILVAYTVDAAGAVGFVHQCGVGFSGVIFGLIVIHSHVTDVDHYSIFGLFPVPAKLYAWALLVFWQLLIPGVSFLGHLGGVLAGQIYVWNWLKPLLLSDTVVTKLERSLCSLCMHASNFILLTNASSSLPVQLRSSGTTSFTWRGLYRRLGMGSEDDPSSGQSTTTGSRENREGRFPGRPQYIGDSAPSQLSTIPVIVEPQDDFDRLVEMGFDQSAVRAALVASDGDFTVAMNKLTGAI